MCAEFDLARFFKFYVVQHHPVGDVTVVAGIQCGDAAFRPDRVSDLHNLRFERAGDIDISCIVVSFDECNAGRVALNAMARRLRSRWPL